MGQELAQCLPSKGACSLMILSPRKRVSAGMPHGSVLGSWHRGWVARYMCAGLSKSEGTRARAEQKLKGGLGPGCAPLIGLRFPGFHPGFLIPNCLLTLFSASALILTRCSSPSVPMNCVWSVVTSPFSLTSPCQSLHAHHCLVQIPMRRCLIGPSTFHMRTLSWALANPCISCQPPPII